MKIAVITDTHNGARNDIEIIADAQERFYTETFFPTLKKRNITTILHLGDFFDRRKHINFKSLDNIKRTFLEPVRKNGYDFGLIAGNHDTYHKNTNKLNSPALLIQDYCKWLWHNEPMELVLGSCKIALIPWINNENYEDIMKFVQQTDAKVCMGHFEFDGFQMMRGIVNDGGMQTKSFEKFHSVYSGHFHHKSTRGNITYLGSPFWLNWTDHGDPRGFHIFDTETLEMEMIENPNPLFHKIKYDGTEPNLPENQQALNNSFVKVLVHDKGDLYLFDRFIDKIVKQEPYDLQIVDLQSDTALATDAQIQQTSKDTLTIIHETVSDLDETEDSVKYQIKQLMSELYSESLGEA